MKPHFKDMSIEDQQNFGDGCTFVPDFIYTASCRIHDFGYSRSGSLKDKIKADYDMCRYMWSDSSKLWHYLVTIIYWLGLTLLPFSYFFFTYGKYREIEDIVTLDNIKKKYK